MSSNNHLVLSSKDWELIQSFLNDSPAPNEKLISLFKESYFIEFRLLNGNVCVRGYSTQSDEYCVRTSISYAKDIVIIKLPYIEYISEAFFDMLIQKAHTEVDYRCVSNLEDLKDDFENIVNFIDEQIFLNDMLPSISSEF